MAKNDYEHRDGVIQALSAANMALSQARSWGHLTDCLGVAVQALTGALKNIQFEIDEAKKKQCQDESK